MEYMAGGDLRRRLLDTGTLPGTEIERIGRALLCALDAAHAKGVIHRDLKPRNVLFSESGASAVETFREIGRAVSQPN